VGDHRVHQRDPFKILISLADDARRVLRDRRLPAIFPDPATTMTHPLNDAACAGRCTDRREFLRGAANVAAVLATVSALTPLQQIAAMEVRANGTVKYPIPTADSVSIDKDNEVILTRFNGEIYAFVLSCPHQNTALRALPGNKGFQCSRHKSRYKQDGTFIDGKATRNMDRLQITREGNEVVVDPNVAYESDTEPAKWGAALVKV
jgi:Rieske Fe-S protein